MHSPSRAALRARAISNSECTLLVTTGLDPVVHAGVQLSRCSGNAQEPRRRMDRRGKPGNDDVRKNEIKEAERRQTYCRQCRIKRMRRAPRKGDYLGLDSEGRLSSKVTAPKNIHLARRTGASLGIQSPQRGGCHATRPIRFDFPWVCKRECNLLGGGYGHETE